MSISQIQRRRVFEEITRTLYASGERPRLIDIMREVSAYFKDYPAGNPLPPFTEHIQMGLPSNAEKVNQMIANLVTNLDVLYEAVGDHQQDLMHLTTLLRTSIENLRARRKKLVTQMDDYLFSLYNVDGYYYSASDSFADLSFTDLSLTSAFVDTYSGRVSLPTISNLTRQVQAESYSGVSISAVSDGTTVPHDTVSPFQGCIDGLSNTIWSTEVELDAPAEVLLRVTVTIGGSDNPIKVSKIDVDPYGITPVQLWVETEAYEDNQTSNVVLEDFGEGIKTSLYQMVFIDQPRVISRVHFWMRKTDPDYTVNRDNRTRYRYIFAAKNISMSEHVFDNQATFVSTPLALPAELRSDEVIDAVSLVARDEVPTDTGIKYYVAPDVTGATEIGEFNWQQIEKIDALNPRAETIIRFDGALKFSRDIRSNPDSGDLQLKQIVTTGPPAEQNPNPEIIPTQDVYRICDFGEEVLTKSLVLEEGVNTTRIYHTDFESGIEVEEALELDYWADFINGTRTDVTTVYGRIDTGNGFFSGGDVGDNGQYIYLETYLESLTDQETFLKRCIKPDSNSRVWDMKAFLNGREVADMPVGTNEVVIPWKFNKGLNHIAMTIAIPETSAAYPSPEQGTVNLLGDSLLTDFGTVKLGTWTYVDFFTMQYNEIDQPKTFTIYEGEIISRRKPTDNFRLRYSKARSTAPDAVRFRADLTRTNDNQYVSPQLDLYRLRFIYT